MRSDCGWPVLVFLHDLLGCLVLSLGLHHVLPGPGWILPQVWQVGSDFPPEENLCWDMSGGWMWCCPEAPEMSVDFHQGVLVLGDAGMVLSSGVS